MLAKYQSKAGSVGKLPSKWPAGAQSALDYNKDTLVMFVHPQCPCSRASIAELNRIMAKCPNRLAVHIYFFRPNNYGDDWVKTDLWRAAAAIPGVSVHEDIDGAQANLFGAETSGYVLLYDTHAKLIFSGGITGSRGHAGDNAGEDTIVSLADGQAVSLTQTSVFGCSLLNNCETAQPGGTK